MSQRSTKVRLCPYPATRHPATCPGPAGSSGPAQLAGNRLRVRKKRYKFYKQPRQGPHTWASSARQLATNRDARPWESGSAATITRKKMAFSRQYDAVS